MANEPSLLVFAYGSNMCLQRMQSRVPTAMAVTIGYVSHRKLAFRKRSEDGSAKADAVSTPSRNDRVWGVVYRLEKREKPLLDRHEFLGIGYDQDMVEVVHEEGTVQAWMYVARSTAVDTSLFPYVWYHDLVVYGAFQHGLPKRYVDYLKSFASVVDPDATRQAENRRLIRG